MDMLLVSVKTALNPFITSSFHEHGLPMDVSVMCTLLGGSKILYLVVEFILITAVFSLIFLPSALPHMPLKDGQGGILLLCKSSAYMHSCILCMGEVFLSHTIHSLEVSEGANYHWPVSSVLCYVYVMFVSFLRLFKSKLPLNSY
jgi:hypothetical protein